GLGRRARLAVGTGSPGDLRKAGAALARLARGRQRVAFAWPRAEAEAATAFAEGALLASYTFTLKSREIPEDKRPASTIDVVGGDGLAEALRRGAQLETATSKA